MTQRLKVLGQLSPAAYVEDVLYVVPVGGSTVISSITVCNTNETTQSYRLIIAVAGATPSSQGSYLVYDETVAANETFSYTLGLSLAETDSIRVYASSSGIAFQAFGQEHNVEATITNSPVTIDGSTFTPAGLALMDDATNVIQRATLGLGDLAVENSPLPVSKGGTGSTTGVSIPIFITFSRSGTLVTGTGTMRWRVPVALTIQHVRLACNTAPTGAAILVDVNKNGTTIFTTQANRPTIAASANAETATIAPDVTALAAGNYLTVDIDQVGSTVAGADLTIVIYAVIA